MNKTAIILGATGLTGSTLLKRLLADPNYTVVKLFSRTATDTKHPKIKEYVIDLFQLENYANDFTADIVFCCIGTTNAKTPDNETYKKIDHGIPVAAANLCKQNNIDTFIVISAMGADPKSRLFYNRTKGEMEQDVLQLNIKTTYIMQPALIAGDRKENRFGEKMAKFFMGILKPVIPKKYQPIHPETIAIAMQKLAANGYVETKIPSDKIKHIAAHA